MAVVAQGQADAGPLPIHSVARHDGQAVQPDRPELPVVALESFPPDVREEARELYERAVQRPDDAESVGALGLLLHAFDQHAAAAAAYHRAHRLDPRSFRWAYSAGVVYSAAGEQSEAIRMLRAAVRLDAGSVPARLKLADALMEGSEFEEAGQLYAAIVETTPGVPGAHYGLGRVAAEQGRLKDAVEHYREAIAQFPEFGAAHYRLALAYRDLADADSAREHLRQYQDHQLRAPPLPDPVLEQVEAFKLGARHHLQRAVALGNRQRIAESIREHELALERDPTLVQAHVNLISLYGQSGQAEKAEAHYRAASALSPNVGEAHYNYGVRLTQQQRFGDAAEAFERTLAIDPGHPGAHNNLGQLLERDGRLEEALRHYRTAITTDPAFRLGRFNAGRMLIALDRPQEAIEELQRTLVPEDEETPRYLFALSVAHVRAGDVERGLEYALEAKQRASAFGQDDLAASIERDVQRLQASRSPR
jgi:tetratricopeptide (TPR) repeat protein